MSSIHRLVCCALALGVQLPAVPASAADGSFSFPPRAAYAQLGADTDLISIRLPKTGGDPGFYFNFVLPQDYSRNDKVSIVFTLEGLSSKYPCTIRFVPTSLERQRPGVADLSSLAGLSAEDGSDLVAFSSIDTSAEKVFKLARNPAFGQRPGDNITLGFNRTTADSKDTCDSWAVVESIDIRYPRVP
jgi:hypothetical protein